jgi:hypothetical protein
MLAAKQGCTQSLECMLTHLTGDEACTEGGASLSGGAHGCSMLRNTAIVAARTGRAAALVSQTPPCAMLPLRVPVQWS